MFNALKYIKNLEAVGVPREQAEAQVQLVIAAIEDEVTTKTEFSEFRSEMKAEFSDVRGEITQLRGEFVQLRGEVKSEISTLKSDLVFKLGALFVGFNTVSFGLFGLLVAYLSQK